MSQDRQKIENNHTVAASLRELSQAVLNLTAANQCKAADKVANIIIALVDKTELINEDRESVSQQGDHQAEDHGPGDATLLESIFRSLASTDLAAELKEKIISPGAPSSACDCGVCQPQTLKSALEQVEGGVDTGDLYINDKGQVYINGNLVGYAVIRR
jgi:hypothetical protein